MSKNLFSESSIYDPQSISVEINNIFSKEIYINLLMREKLKLVDKYLKQNGILLDLGCSTGTILEYFLHKSSRLIGVDYTKRYIDEAIKKFVGKDIKPEFYCEDICNLSKIPDLISSGGIDCSYSFSTLYVVEKFNKFVTELYKITSNNGFAILDLGNSRSLNFYCCKFYTENDGFAPLANITIDNQLSILKNCGFSICEHRCFQLLPLWAGKPRWLWPLLHPKWNNIMKRKIKGKMLDEWISSLPLLRNFAFRHLVVCKK